MGAQVKILIEGYTNADYAAETGEEKTQPTITLVRDENFVIVVDPGIMESQQVLKNALAEESLALEDVNYVCLTHSHLDHFRNAGMFPNAKVIEYFGVWERNTVNEWQEQFSENIQIVKTPGHAHTDITLFVKTEDGVIAICGDVFWKEDYPHDPYDDPFASDPEKLKQSRQTVIKMADWIVPGHGPMFKSHKLEAAEKGRGELRNNKTQKAAVCRRCNSQMKLSDKCLCRPWLCYRCCECCFDCELCSCSHKRK